jgi:hypothetical protein
VAIRGKGNRIERLPLPAGVGEAVAAWASAASPLTQRWKTLQHVTASPGRIGLIARAAHFVLVLFEHKIIT